MIYGVWRRDHLVLGLMALEVTEENMAMMFNISLVNEASKVFAGLGLCPFVVAMQSFISRMENENRCFPYRVSSYVPHSM